MVRVKASDRDRFNEICIKRDMTQAAFFHEVLEFFIHGQGGWDAL